MNQAMQRATDLLETAEATVVTTVDHEGRPQSRAMFNLRNAVQFPGLRAFFATRPPFEIWLTTNTSSGKLRDLRANPAISVYVCRPAEFRGLMLGGDVEVVDDPAEKGAIWQKNWTLYYPAGCMDPDHTVLRLTPRLVKYYHQLETSILVGAR